MSVYNITVAYTRCLNRSGQTHVRYAANKEEISSDGSLKLTYSVNSKKHSNIPIRAVLHGTLLLDTRSPAVAEGPRERAVSRNLVKYCTNVRWIALERPANGE